MAEKFKKDKAHQRYRTADGAIVPGVTTITALRDKSHFLIPWANKLGLEGIDSSQYRDTRAEIGTVCHYLIQCHVRGEAPDPAVLSEYAPKVVSYAENGFLHWLSWEKERGGFECMLSEKQLTSEAYKYGGTIDLYGSLGGKLCLIDIKTSPAIYDDMFNQVAAYHQLLVENGHDVEDLYIVRCGRGDDDDGFDHRHRSPAQSDKRFQIFLHLLGVYYLEKELRKENA